MKRSFVLACLVLGMGCGSYAQAPAQPMDTTVCDVVKKPEAFDGKMVRIKGTVVAGFDQFTIKDSTDPNCGYPVNVIWLSYPPGSKGKAGPAAMLTVQPARNFTGKYTAPARTAVTLDKSKDFKQFDSLLAQKHEKGADMCLGCTRYEVTATLVGRLDGVADAALKHDASGKIVGFGGFGNMNAYPARLVLESVSDVTPKEIDFSKNDEETKGGRASGPGNLYSAMTASQNAMSTSASGSSNDIYGAIAVAQKVAAALAAGPPKDAAVKAAAVYGKPGAGERTGVYLNYGPANEASPKDEALGAKDSPDGVLFNCTFNSDRLQGDALTRAVIHLGEHVSELRNPGPGIEEVPAVVLESDAWVVTTITAVASGQLFLTLPGGYLIWDINWPAAERNDKTEAVLKDFLANEALLSH